MKWETLPGFPGAKQETTAASPELLKSGKLCLREAPYPYGLLSWQVYNELKSNSNFPEPKESLALGKGRLAGMCAYVTLQCAGKLPGEY